MSTQSKKSSQKPSRPVGRVMRRLLAAVDRSISAADDARRARDELVRLATTGQQADLQAASAKPSPQAPAEENGTS